MSHRRTKYVELFEALSEDWRIEFDELVLDRILGRGASGEVRLAYWRGATVAVKTLHITKMLQRDLENFIREVEMLRQLHHPNIVMFLGAVVQAPHFMMVSEFMHHGSLADLLHNSEVAIGWAERISIAKQAARGMLYLHSFNPPIIHRDLKSLNILVDRGFITKIGDLGLAKLRDDSKTMTMCGTPLWSSPEVLRHARYTEKADVYSYGIVLWEVLERQFPYEDLGTFEVVIKVSQQMFRPQIPTDCPPRYATLMRKCWEHNPVKRTNFREILNELAVLGEELQLNSIEEKGEPGAIASENDYTSEEVSSIREDDDLVIFESAHSGVFASELDETVQPLTASVNSVTGELLPLLSDTSYDHNRR